MKMLGILGSIGLFLGVALGAFAAHGLRSQIPEPMQNVFETGVRYQMFHSITILIAAFFYFRSSLFHYAGILYAIGIVLFSFSLYLLAVTGTKWFGIITPLGGLNFLAGHLLLLIGFIKMK
jgi:uncharacterized membrane protein YgdD (TMEM256/DUF423 family)